MKYLLGAGEDPDDCAVVCDTTSGHPLLFGSVEDAGAAARTLINDPDDPTHHGTTFYVLKAVPVAAYMPAAGEIHEVRHDPDPEPETN